MWHDRVVKGKSGAAMQYDKVVKVKPRAAMRHDSCESQATSSNAAL